MNDAPTRSSTRARLAACLLLQYAVGGAFWPFLTMYFRDKQLSFVELAQIHVVMAAFQSTMPLLWGFLADRFLRIDRILVALHAAGALSLLFLATHDGYWGLLAGAALWHATGSATFALSNALAYHNLRSPRDEFGGVRLWGSIGWMLPALPVWAWLHFRDSADLRVTLYLAAALEAAFVFAAPLLPRTPPPAAVDGDGGGDARLPFARALGVLLRRPAFWVLLAIVTLMFWSFTVFFYYSPLHLEALGVPRRWYGLIQNVGVIVEVPLLWLLPRVLARLGYARTIALGCGVLAARQLLFATVGAPAALIATFPLVGLAVVFYLVTLSLAVDALAGREVRATAQALVVLAGPGIGNAVGHLVSGQVAERNPAGLQPVFLAAAVTAAVAAVLVSLVALLRRRSGADGGAR